MADTPPSRAPVAGGVLIAFGALAGSLVGFAVGQATPGLLAGIGLGAAASLLIWLLDRRR